MRALEDSVDENAGGVYLVGIELAGFDQFFDFGDDVIGGGSHHGIEVSRSLAINEIAPAIAFPRFDEGEIAAEAALHDVHAAVEFAGFFSFGDHGAVASGRVKRGNTGAAGAQALGERALGIEFDLEFSAQDQLLEEFVFAHVGGNHFLHLALLEKQADAEVVYARVVANDGEVFCAFAANGGDEIFRDAAQTEAAHENGRAVGELFDGGVGGNDAFVHKKVSVASCKLFVLRRKKQDGHPAVSSWFVKEKARCRCGGKAHPRFSQCSSNKRAWAKFAMLARNT